MRQTHKNASNEEKQAEHAVGCVEKCCLCPVLLSCSLLSTALQVALTFPKNCHVSVYRQREIKKLKYPQVRHNLTEVKLQSEKRQNISRAIPKLDGPSVVVLVEAAFCIFH
jgi:hypothetical protein